VRCYVSYLEKAIIATCAALGVKAITTENTGVWLNDQQKIAAIGTFSFDLVWTLTIAMRRSPN